LQRPDALRERGAEDADFHVRFRDAGLSAEEVAVVVREALQPVELLSGRLRVAEGVEAPALAHAYAEEAALREPPPEPRVDRRGELAVKDSHGAPAPR